MEIKINEMKEMVEAVLEFMNGKPAVEVIGILGIALEHAMGAFVVNLAEKSEDKDFVNDVFNPVTEVKQQVVNMLDKKTMLFLAGVAAAFEDKNLEEQ